MNERTIKITGEAKKKYRPDRIRVDITYEDVFEDYALAMGVASGYTGIIKEQAALAGVDPSLVKTAYFNVEQKKESTKDDKGVYRTRMVGYKAFVHYTIRIPVDNALLAELLYALRKYTEGISFTYVLEDREKANDEVLELAVANATKKANLLAKAAGVELGELLSVDYSYGRIRVANECGCYDCAMETAQDLGSAPEIDIDPEDLELSDCVTMVWAIK